MAQEDEILSLHDALLASVAKSENSRGSCGEDDEINDEELTALRFAALISKKSKHQSKPQPISTTVPAVPSAAPTPQNKSVLPASPVTLQHSSPVHHVTGVFPGQYPAQHRAQSYRQHFPSQKHGTMSQFSSHHPQKRTSNLIVIQTQQPQQAKNASALNKGPSHPRNEPSSGKSVFLRPQDKWDKSREEVKCAESPEPKVSAKFRRLMSKDSDSDDDDDDESNDGNGIADSLFVSPGSDDETKSDGSAAVLEEDSDSERNSNQCDQQQSDIDSDLGEKDDGTPPSSPNNEKASPDNENASPDKDKVLAQTTSGSESSMEQSPSASSSPSRKSISSQNSHRSSGSRQSSSPERHSTSAQSSKGSNSSRSPSSHGSHRKSNSPKRYSSSPSSGRSSHSMRSARRYSSSSSPDSRSMSPQNSSRSPSQHYPDRSPPGRHRPQRYSRSRSRSPLVHGRYTSRRQRSRSLSPPGLLERGDGSLRKPSMSPDQSHVRHRTRRHSNSPLSHNSHDWNRSPKRHSPSWYSYEQGRSRRRHSGSHSPHCSYRLSRSRHPQNSVRSPLRSPSEGRRRNRSPLRHSQSPRHSRVRHQSSSPGITRSPYKLHPRSTTDARSPNSHYHASGTSSQSYQSGVTEHNRNRSRSRATEDSRSRDYRLRHSCGETSKEEKKEPARDLRQRLKKDVCSDGKHSSGTQHLPGRNRERSSSVDRGITDRETTGHHSSRSRSSHHRLHHEVSITRNKSSEKNSENHSAEVRSSKDAHPSASQNKENKYHRKSRLGARGHNEKKISDEKLLPKKDASSLSAEEQAKLEARQKKFASLSEVKPTQPKKILLKDIVRSSSDKEKPVASQSNDSHKSRVHPAEEDRFGRSRKKVRKERDFTDTEVKSEQAVKQPQDDGECKTDRKSSYFGDESLNNQKNYLAHGSSGSKQLLSVVATTTGSREICYKDEEETTDVKLESKGKASELEDARQIILRVKQKGKELKASEAEVVKKEKMVSDVASPKISVTFNKDQSRLPVYKRLGQPVTRREKKKTLAKQVTVNTKSELAEEGNRGKYDDTDVIHVGSKTMDLRNILESRKDAFKATSLFKGKSKRLNRDGAPGEKKKIRLKRPGRTVHSVVMDGADQC